MQCIISFQSFVSFANTFLLPSVEVKTKCSLPLFSLIYPSTLPMSRYNGFTLLYFHNHQIFFYCDVTNIIDANIILGFLIIICTILNINLINISHLYVQ